MSNKQKPTVLERLPLNVKVALLLFMLAGGLAMAIIPRTLHHNGSTVPPFSLFLVTGLAAVALTSVLFAYLGRLGLGFGARALTLAFGYNVVIAIIKTILSPHALYLSNQHIQFSTLTSSPNTVFFYELTAATVLLLYVLVFGFMHRYFARRLSAQQGKKAAAKSKRRFLTKKRTGFLILAVVLTALSGGVVLLAPLLFLGPSVTYLAYIFGALAIPLAVALALAIFLAHQSFAAVEKQAIATGNATLLASFFWLGLSLIFLYHVMWVVLMITLVNIWPFSTYTPK